MTETKDKSPSAGASEAKPRKELKPNHPGQRLTLCQSRGGSFYVVSTVHGPWATETMVFKANADGEVTDWSGERQTDPDHEGGMEWVEREAPQ